MSDNQILGGGREEGVGMSMTQRALLTAFIYLCIVTFVSFFYSFAQEMIHEFKKMA